MTPLCFIDTETTGVHPDRQVWEIAMIRRDDKGERDVSFYVDVDLSDADPFGLSVGRFYDRHPTGRWMSFSSGYVPDRPAASTTGNFLTRRTAADAVARWTHGAHLVGAVPNFDAETLAPLLREHALIPCWHYHLIDVEALAFGWLAAQDNVDLEPPWRSDALSNGVGVAPPTQEERHTALGDARWAMRLYDAIVKRT